MADAYKTIQVTIETVEVEHEETHVHLNLSLEEASALLRVTKNVGGHPSESRRGLLDNIRRALEDTNISWGANDVRQNAYGVCFRNSAKVAAEAEALCDCPNGS